jgi:hypothetical protein
MLREHAHLLLSADANDDDGAGAGAGGGDTTVVAIVAAWIASTPFNLGISFLSACLSGAAHLASSARNTRLWVGERMVVSGGLSTVYSPPVQVPLAARSRGKLGPTRPHRVAVGNTRRASPKVRPV